MTSLFRAGSPFESFVKRVISPARVASASLHAAALGLALLFAVLVLGAILAAYGTGPTAVADVVANYALTGPGWVAIINKATTYYLSGLAAAVGFRMLLFNIGIDGQYRLGVFGAAVIGGAIGLPMFLQIPIMIVVACGVAAAYGAIAAYLRAERGVSEVISTIMLNSVATGLISYLLSPKRFGVQEEGSNNVQTALISESGQLPSISIPGAGEVYGFTVFAALIGLLYWAVTERSRFGFELTASGSAPRAAAMSGTNPKRMIMVTLIASAALAGTAGLPELLGSTHRYGIGFPAGLAWVGLSVAIVGRNHPIGVSMAALLWAFLERCALPLDLLGVPKEVISVVQAAVVLAVVAMYELVHQVSQRRDQRRAASFARPAVAEGSAS